MAKTRKNKNIGKVVYVYLPSNSRPRYRWIVGQKPNGQLVARTPKNKVKIKDLHLKRNKDYGKEHLLPKNIRFYS